MVPWSVVTIGHSPTTGYDAHCCVLVLYRTGLIGIAGVGNDPRSSRQFNPIKQANDYDPHGEYVRTWLPELKDVPTELVQIPWRESATNVLHRPRVLSMTMTRPSSTVVPIRVLVLIQHATCSSPRPEQAWWVSSQTAGGESTVEEAL